MAKTEINQTRIKSEEGMELDYTTILLSTDEEDKDDIKENRFQEFLILNQ